MQDCVRVREPMAEASTRSFANPLTDDAAQDDSTFDVEAADGTAQQRFAGAVAAWRAKKKRSGSAKKAAATRKAHVAYRKEKAKRRKASIDGQAAAAKRAEAARYADSAPQRAKIKAAGRIPKRQAGRGAAYDSGTDDDDY